MGARPILTRAPRRPALQRPAVRVGLVAAATFVAALALFARADGFDYRYHPDEPSKAAQVATGDYNFNHPQLTLRVAEAVALLQTGNARSFTSAGEPQVPRFQRIVTGGRRGSAFFGAVAAAVFAGLAARARGVLAGVATGAGLATFGPLLAAAHFFKEDTALVMTIAVWLAAASWHLERRTWASAAGLAVACGLALCGKWAGGVLTVAGLGMLGVVGVGRSYAAGPLPLSLRGRGYSARVRAGVQRRPDAGASGFGERIDARPHPPFGHPLPEGEWEEASLTGDAAHAPPRRLAPLTLGVAATLAVVALVNLPAFWQLPALLGGWRREAQHVATGHQGLLLPRWPVYAREFLSLGPVVIGLALVEVIATTLRPERRSRGWWLVPAVAVGWAALVVPSRVVTPRYVLPCVVLLVTLAGMGLGTVAGCAYRATARWVGGGGTNPVDLAIKQLIRGAAAALVASAATAALLAAWLVPQGLTTRQYLGQFAHDTRDDARAWLAANLAPTDRLAFDEWTGLSTYGLPPGSERLPLTLENATVEQLAAEGFTHLVVADRSYGPFLTPGVSATPGYADTLARVRGRYERLQAGESAARVADFAPDAEPPTHMSPRVTVYRLPAPTTDASSAP